MDLLPVRVAEFAHSPLDRNSQQIRLIRINPSTLNGILICTLQTVDVVAAPPRTLPTYIALSYTWGPPSPSKEILVDGMRLEVRENLWDFLIVARKQYSHNLFWIDQISIDQNNTEEKNHQVSLMSQVYRNAHYVMVWLGSTADDSDCAMDLISGRGRTPPTRQRKLKDIFTSHQIDEYQAAIRDLFARPYWNRLWVVQEVKLGREVWILCGQKLIPWHRVKGFVEWNMRNQKIYRDLVISPEAASLILGHTVRYVSNIDPIFVHEKSSRAGYEPYWWNPQTLRHNIYMYHRFQCSNPRDKIYGFLGLLNQGCGPEEPSHIRIDYNKSVEEVFWDFFTSSSINYLQAISYANQPFSSTKPLPGWFSFGVMLMKEMGIYSPEKEQELIDILNGIEETLGVRPQRITKDGNLPRKPGFKHLSYVGPPPHPSFWARGGILEKVVDRICSSINQY